MKRLSEYEANEALAAQAQRRRAPVVSAGTADKIVFFFCTHSGAALLAVMLFKKYFGGC